MEINRESLDQFDEQTEDSLRRLNKLWQLSKTLPTLQNQPLTEALEEHNLTIQELQVALEELLQQNEELAAIHNVLATERQRYQELFEFAPDGYLVTDAAGVIVEANQAAARMLNVSQKSLVGKPLVVFVTAEARHDFHTQLNQLHSNEARDWELQIQPRQQQSFPAAFRVVAARNRGQIASLHWGLRDISKRKQYEAHLEIARSDLEKQVEERTAELSKANQQLKQEIAQRSLAETALQQLNTELEHQVQAQVKELQQLSHIKDDFLSTVSHELRTPVANMKMAIQMLAISLNRDQPLLAQLAKPPAEQSRVTRYFQILYNECEREIKLINDLLDLQHLYAGVQPLVLTSIQLQDWLPQIVEPFQARARNRQLDLQVDISPQVPCFICDPTNLGRVLGELLENACKHTPPGEQIVVTAQMQSGMVQLSVSNSGVEIPASDINYIFDKFYRVPSTDPWKQGGTGLGLALVQQLVAQLKGTIQVESVAGQTRFILELPLNNTG